jgi:SAM-dependent methyltransferase
MERIVYDRMAELDSRHWWYRARREILADLIGRRIVLPPEDPRILEIGCGTGHNLVMLKRFGRVDAIEIDGAARAIASQRLGHAVMDAPLPR